MDEIELLKNIKKISQKVNIVILLIMGSIGIISFLIFPSNDAVFTSMAILIMGIIFSIINFLVYITISIMYKLSYSKLDFKNINKEYCRDICNSYPPAIASLLYNNKIEIYRDYTATILELYIKKYINIIDFDKEVKIYQAKNKDLMELKAHEIYVYDCIINNVKFDGDKFEKLILEDTENAGLVKKEKIDFIGIISIIILLLIYSSILILSIMNNEPQTMAVMLLILIPIIGCGRKIYKYILEKVINKYKITKKGKEERKKINAFKNFIKDYTLIEEKDIEHIEILEEYIPYSLSLGASPQVEEYIKQNEIYRNLIYKGRENWT